MNNTEMRKARQQLVHLDIPDIVVPDPTFEDPLAPFYSSKPIPEPSPTTRQDLYRYLIEDIAKTLKKVDPRMVNPEGIREGLIRTVNNAKIDRFGELGPHEDESLEVRLEYNFLGEPYLAFYYDYENLFGELV